MTMPVRDRSSLPWWAGRLLALLLLAVTGARSAVAQSAAAIDSTSLAAVRGYIEAYNAHDVDGVIRRLDPYFVWLSLAGDSLTVEVRGASEVRASLTDYFRDYPSAHSDIEAATALGPWVTVRERARWQDSSGARSQAGISVYEVRDGLLRRVWYYPVVR